MSKPTFASVTDVACTCGSLQRSADDPDLPIEFDPKTNEYQFTYHSPVGNGLSGSMVIYHCPFCGGAAPPSKRASLFAVVSHREKERLDAMFDQIKTLDDAIAKFGPPDDDLSHGVTVRTKEEDDRPSEIQSFRTIRYGGLSETADVHIADYGRDGVAISYQGKYHGGADG